MSEWLHIGVVKALYHFPVKSMRGEKLDEAQVGWYGFHGDRRYAFVRTGNATNFPWLTGREAPKLVRYTPYFSLPDQPNTSPVWVATPQGDDWPVESPELLEELKELYGAPVHLVQSNRGNFDSANLSLISTATIEGIGNNIGEELDERRFRQNIVVDLVGEDKQAFYEEKWLGHRVTFGEEQHEDFTAIRFNRLNKRCMMVNIEPDTARQTPAVLREIAQNRANCLGVYASPERIGSIKVGDAVRVYKGN